MPVVERVPARSPAEEPALLLRGDALEGDPHVLGVDELVGRSPELARLRALIRRSAGQGTSELQVRDVVIDTRARRVVRGGQPVTLTARGRSSAASPAHDSK